MNQNSPAYYQGQPQQAISTPQGVNPNPIIPPGANIQQTTNLPPNQIAFHSDSDIVNDGLIDPISKCKELFSHLRNSLQFLLYQLSVVLNPANETKPTVENQFQLLGKYIENFNRVCDLLVVNLRTACEAQMISNEIKNFTRYASMGPMDINRQDNSLLNSVNIQMQRINEFRSMLQKYLSVTEVKAQPHTQPPSVAAPVPTPNSNSMEN